MKSPQIVRGYGPGRGVRSMYAIAPDRLLKNAHLLRCAANLIVRRIRLIRLTLRFLRALHLSIFEQPQNREFFNTLLMNGLLYENRAPSDEVRLEKTECNLKNNMV